MRVLFTGVACNISHSIDHWKSQYAALQKQEWNLSALIYEVSSSDNTLEQLHLWAKEDTSITIKSDRIHKSEIEKHCLGRDVNNNVCQFEIEALHMNALLNLIVLDDFDYIIFAHLPVKFTLPCQPLHNAISKSFDRTQDFDAMIPYVRLSEDTNMTLDIGAFRDEIYPFGPEVLSHICSSTDYKDRLFKHIDDLPSMSRVFSAFFGLAVFKASSISNAKFTVYPTKYLDLLCRTRADELIIPSIEHLYDIPLGCRYFESKTIFYYYNSGVNIPLVNMFVGFFMQMLENQKTDIFLNKKVLLQPVSSGSRV